MPPLSTRGRDLVDARNASVKLVCVNWYGLDQLDFVLGGLNFASMADIAAQIVGMGFNCVRLPWALQLVIQNPRIGAYAVTKEPLLQGNATGMDAFDAAVAALDAAGLMIILDNHMSDSNWCCSETDGNGLWYTTNYSANAWLTTWQLVAARYAGVRNVIGADLRNELRSATVNGEYLTPTWGSGDPATDWHAAATQAGAVVQSIAPHWLIIVEGLNYATDLTGVSQYPVQLPNVVYEAHNYVFSNSWDLSCDEFALANDVAWGYIVNMSNPAPVWVGEIGTCNTNDTACVRGPIGQGAWWPCLMQYLAANEFNVGYWAVDGTQSTGAGRTFGAPGE